jgi:hypothetical protein
MPRQHALFAAIEYVPRPIARTPRHPTRVRDFFCVCHDVHGERDGMCVLIARVVLFPKLDLLCR